ncbi:MAG TPA: ABC transporter ATP-binding protein [Actinopolymorphaceae bacterium]|nr:ABC transporter ATP-binding protein [Actinopolymorphaceae bacterium]
MSEAALTVTGLGVRTSSHALLRDVTFALEPGERVGLVGESGSGKSLTALAVLGLLPDGLSASGAVRLAGMTPDLTDADERTLSAVRGNRMSMVFQEPLSALNPVQRVGDQVAEVVRIHQSGVRRTAASAQAVELLERVRLSHPAQAARAYPHQLSGGQRQRVMIAMALANDPTVLLCDEPTSALDVTVQAQILDLIVADTSARGTSLLFITHDLAVVSRVCSRVLVMREGAIVETGPVAEVFSRPSHPYTRALLAAAAALTGPPRSRRSVSPGTMGPGGSVGSVGTTPLLEARDVSRTFRRPRHSLLSPPLQVTALRDVSLEIAPGERFGIVGESGSGKSTLVRLLAGLDTPSAGSIRFSGREIGGLPERHRRFLREDLQMVFQDPAGSLDPRMRVGQIVAEPLAALRRPADRRGRLGRVAELLDAVGLPAGAADRYPHQFSGGQRQRISIARALAPAPKVLVADEPVSALDAPIRTQILDLLASLADAYELTLVFVSHDLNVVRQLCDTVAVLHQGEIVELGPTEEVYAAPSHAYTRALLAAVPTIADGVTSGPTWAE